MKRVYFMLVTCWMMVLACSVEIKAQDAFEANVGGDLVSGYIWRGQDLGNVSIQPSLSIAYKGFSLSAWGSVGFTESDTKEFDLTLGYTVGGLNLSITDYWFTGGSGYFHYANGKTSHVFEAHVGYDFGFLALNWNTNFAGNDGLNKQGKRAYASYFSLAVPFQFATLDWNAEIGATPWANTFYKGAEDGFAVCQVSLKAAKDIKLTTDYSLAVYAQTIWNPATEGAFFVLGINI